MLENPILLYTQTPNGSMCSKKLKAHNPKIALGIDFDAENKAIADYKIVEL